MSNYSKERIEIGDCYKDMMTRGIKMDEASFIRWAQYLYEVDFATVKNAINDANNLIAMEQQAELSQDINKDDVVNNIVENLDNKLSAEEQQILEDFNE